MTVKTKPSLVLLHGWGMNQRIWQVPDESGQGLLEQLQERFEVQVLDLPGYGADRDYGGEYSLTEIARRVLDRAPRRAVWVAWSLGATVAMQVSLLAPERVSGLQLISPTAHFGAASGWEQSNSYASLLELKRRFKLSYSVGLKYFLMLQTQDRKLMRRVGEAISQMPEPLEAIMDRSLQLLTDTDLRDQIGQIGVPTQVLVGAEDRVVPLRSSRDLFEQLNLPEPSQKQWGSLAGGHLCFLESRPAYLEALTAVVEPETADREA